MRKVLIVAYYYPPSAEMGVYRTLKFTQRLPALGFSPYVLTAKNRSFSSVDHALLSEVPAEATVIETFSAEHRVLRAPRLLGLDPRWLFLPDVQIGWIPFAVRRGLDVIRRERIDVMLVSAPVFTAGLVGYRLKQKTGIPLVLDLRDQWAESVFATYPTAFHRWVEQKMERMVVGAADYVITTTDPIREALTEKFPFLANRSETIPNGIDPEDFRGLKRSASADKFTIAYAGRLYGPRTARHFLMAVHNIVRKDKDLRGQFRVLFAGPRNKRTERLVSELQLADVVELLGFVPHHESLQLMVNADVLLLLMAREEAANKMNGTIMVPGKTYEYLGAQRPILALVPEGAVAELIRGTASGTVVPPDEPAGIEEAIISLFRAWQSGTLGLGVTDVSRYERKALAPRLAAILESCCQARMRLQTMIPPRPA